MAIVCLELITSDYFEHAAVWAVHALVGAENMTLAVVLFLALIGVGADLPPSCVGTNNPNVEQGLNIMCMVDCLDQHGSLHLQYPIFLIRQFTKATLNDTSRRTLYE